MIFLVMKCHLGGAPWGDVPRFVPGTTSVPHSIIIPEKGKDTRFTRPGTSGDHTGARGTRGGVGGKGLGEVVEKAWT